MNTLYDYQLHTCVEATRLNQGLRRNLSGNHGIPGSVGIY
jgi:hypothetical protein